MTIYYLTTTFGNKPNAGSKARNDVNEIFKNRGFTSIEIESNSIEKKNKIEKFLYHKEYIKNTKKILSILNKDDVLFYQHPIQGALEFNQLAKILQKKKVKLVAIVHDLEIFRKWDLNYSRKRAELNDIKILSKCEKIILHNRSMIDSFQKETGIRKENLVNLEIFDYLFSRKEKTNNFTENKVTIAGNLRREKAGYIYNLENIKCNFILYGMGYSSESNGNIDYKGSVDPDKLVYELVGKYGLVWDGELISTCSGSTGEYLKVNNPHKTSLYLAAELPIIIWEEAALAPFILENKIGFTVKSIEDIPDIIKSINDKDYEIMRKNCELISQKIEVGYFTNKAIDFTLKRS